jgi:hypothetical protein
LHFIVQPLDQSIIKNFKAFYRTTLVKNLLSKIESVDNIQGLTKAINVLDAVYFINNAWQHVTNQTIKSFRKSGITCENYENTISNDDFSIEDDLPLKTLAEIWRNSQAIGNNLGV